ncbi:MAG TPA: TetR/AcrR family transcriptional regulator [Solirubrobacteraceae bacterium]|nr:TetR/AcrR family transcriptional regulator [Solirubrobacteraceae bacterium]
MTASQRERLISAMGELVGENGYASTTVAKVTARAGVSRKAFYQHFANKQGCFLAAYDTIAAEGRSEVSRAYEAAANPAKGAESAIANLFERAVENPGGVRVALVEAGAIGQAGIERRERLMSEYEGLLRDMLRLPAGPGTVPNPVLRGIVGGLNGVLNAHVRSGRVEQLRELIPDLVGWATSYNPPPPSMLRLLTQSTNGHALPPGLVGGRAPGTLALDAPATAGGGRRGLARGKHGVSRSLVVHSQRERILDAVANLAAKDGYASLTVEGIVERAAVSLQAFYEHFTGKEDAFLVAYELGHAKSLSIVERAYAAQPDWRLGVREGISALFDFLASEPAFAHLALVDALTATRRTAERAIDGAAAYAEMLIPGAEQATDLVLPPAVTIEAIAGGLFELCLTYVLQGHTERLSELLPRATYFALAPFIGPEQAGYSATASVTA